MIFIPVSFLSERPFRCYSSFAENEINAADGILRYFINTEFIVLESTLVIFLRYNALSRVLASDHKNFKYNELGLLLQETSYRNILANDVVGVRSNSYVVPNEGRYNIINV
uniref:Uncharacterized protein n=1 Tax=Glossina austeni TaxID=7395 RepID=A0A1A9VRH2_GLOAU